MEVSPGIFSVQNGYIDRFLLQESIASQALRAVANAKPRAPQDFLLQLQDRLFAFQHKNFAGHAFSQ